MDHDLLGYLLKLDDAETRLQVEAHLAADPDSARQLELLRKAVLPLEADRETPAAPPDLTDRTLGRIAEHICTTGNQLPRDETDVPVGQILARMSPRKLLALVELMDRANSAPSRWRRGDLVVAASIGLIALGLCLTAIAQFRQRQSIQACQNQMREYHGALQTFSDTHNREFPRVSDAPPFNTAASFLPILRQSGTLSPTVLGGCPSAEVPMPGYAYSLGYREGGQLFGLRRNDDDPNNTLMAILADRPPDRDGPGPAHGSGQNVLFVGGNVRYCTTSRVGVNGDDIYWNEFGFRGAGAHRYDSALGLGPDQP
jgi:hypothetical protein